MMTDQEKRDLDHKWWDRMLNPITGLKVETRKEIKDERS